MRTTHETVRGSVRRQAILDGLVSLFLSEGFSTFSVEALAARMQCSKSTLYLVAPSKEQLITATVRAFFREATEQIEAELAAEDDPVSRIGTYLEAISRALAPATSRFYEDLEAFAPAKGIYAQNTAIAVQRVRDLAAAAAGPGHDAKARFIAAVAGATMESIQRGELGTTTSLDDATAYRMLADLIVAGASHTERTPVS